ncbi:MAG: phosphatase [Spirochaetae bacterium HGW-Spirochaetae-5]|nr:MAG: phosphatase [Spirochaetae bacterium HGW-Spirochaetae-5]
MKIEISKNTKGLIFDMDGTLADSMPIHFKAWKLTAIENGFEYTEKQFLDTAGMPTLKIVPLINKELGLSLDPVEFSRRKEELFLENIGDLKLIEPVADIVRKYHNILPMSIGTGGKKEIAILTLKMLGFDKYFNIIVSAEDVKNHKPYPDTFLKCAELMNVPPEFCQVFEDGEMGLIAAERAGMIVTDVRPYL